MLLFIDCETGGLDPVNNALLEFYAEVYDESLTRVDSLYLPIHPNGKRVDDGALKVNGIDMQKHLRKAISANDASARFIEFLQAHQKLTLVAWNLKFDLAFVTNHLAPESIFRSFVYNRDIDLLMVARFMLKTEKFNLQKVAEYLNLPNIDHHTAYGDVQMLVGIYRALKEKIN